jgi:hypothetical protein
VTCAAPKTKSSFQAALAFDGELANSGLMPDLLLARAMLGDMAAASEARILKKSSL